MGTHTLRRARLHRTSPAVVAILLGFLAAGCGDDEIPGVDPAPTRSVSARASAGEIPRVDPAPTGSVSARSGADEIPGVPVTGTPAPTPSDETGPACGADCLLGRALAAERSDLRSQTTEDAQAKLAQLSGVPGGTVPALRFLAGYQWSSATAEDLYGEARRQAGLD